MSTLRSLLVGTVAGAVGTTALNLTTYADMVARARPASETPSNFVKTVAAANDIEALAADDDAAKNRRSGVGALLGYANGLGVGAAFGVLRPGLRGVPLIIAALAVGGAAMALSDVPLVRAGVTDPHSWSKADWISDAVPHVVFGLALVIAFDALSE